MIKRITYFGPHKTALSVALVFAISSLLFLFPMMIMFSLMPMTDPQGNPVNASFPANMFIIMPIFYFIFGYIFIALGAWLYNKVSKYTGGIEIETTE
jgi:hypothetical protein